MRKTKKLLAGLLALLLAFTGVPLYGMDVQAAETVKSEGNFTYTVNEDGNSITITDYTDLTTSEKEVTIPEEIEGKKVTSIGTSTFNGCTNLVKLILPDCITSIGDNAFFHCSNLKEINIPDSVDYIGTGAFDSCSNLTELDIPGNITYIGSSAFSNCTSLMSITIPEDSITSISNSMFSNCSSLTNFIIPSSVNSIDFGAFSNCTSLTKLVIPSKVTSIIDTAFNGCSGLESITIAKENKIYDSRDNLNSIIDTRDNRLILGCKNTTIPDGVTSIAAKAFLNCSGLTDISIPNSVTFIGESAFAGCSGLTELTLSTKNIYSYAFQNCSGLVNLTLSDDVEMVGNSAFLGCSNLANVRIPYSVTSIGEYAFGYIPNAYNPQVNDKIKSFTIHGEYGSAAEAYATEKVFDFVGIFNISNAVITVEQDSYTYTGAPLTPDITVKLDDKILTLNTDYNVSYSDNTNEGTATVTVTGIGNYTRSATTTFDITMDGTEGDYDYTINEDKNSVTITGYIGSSAKDCNIPAKIAGRNVTAIDKFAFSDSSFTNLTIPNSVTFINESAFENCKNLTSITIPDSLTSVAEYAFYNCPSLKSVTIPDSVTSIERRAFGFYEVYREIIPIPGFTIYGKAGSCAERYATEYGFSFNQPSGTDNPSGGNNSSDDSNSSGNNSSSGNGNSSGTDNSSGSNNSSGNSNSSETNNSSGNNNSSENNGSTETNTTRQPITCKKKTYSVAYGAKPFKLNVTSNGSLTYQSSNSKIATVGKTNGKVTIKNTGIVSITAKTKTASVKITIKISPKKPAVKSLKVNKGKKLTVKWTKDKKATGYQIQVSTAKNFKKNTKKLNATKNSCTFKKLKAGKKYYVRLRSYKKSGKNTLYSAWSNPKQSGKIKQ